MQEQFTDYIPGTEIPAERGRMVPRLEAGTVIDRVSFVTDLDGECWFVDPENGILSVVQKRKSDV